MMQAFVDESGMVNDTRHFAMCAVLTSEQNWAAFSQEWQACLDKEPRLKSFKMKDAARKTGTWHRFSPEQQDDRLREFAQIANRHIEMVFHSVIDLPSHARTWARFSDKPRSDPYFFPFHNTINAISFQLHDMGHRDKFEIVFDKQVIFGPRAISWYPIMREIMKDREPEVLKVLPLKPKFGSDELYLPIQAADMFAWWIRNSYDEPNSKSLDWLPS